MGGRGLCACVNKHEQGGARGSRQTAAGVPPQNRLNLLSGVVFPTWRRRSFHVPPMRSIWRYSDEDGRPDERGERCERAGSTVAPSAEQSRCFAGSSLVPRWIVGGATWHFDMLVHTWFHQSIHSLHFPSSPGGDTAPSNRQHQSQWDCIHFLGLLRGSTQMCPLKPHQ